MTSSDELMEYQEGNRIVISYGQLILMAGSIFISASFTIFGLSFSIPKPTFWALFMMSVASVLLYGIFLIYNERYTGFRRKIFPMLRDFEKKNMKMKFHTTIDDADKRLKEESQFYYNIRRIRVWNYCGFVALIILWSFRIIFSGTL